MLLSHAGWALRSVLAGTAGTATMTLAYGVERRLRRGPTGPLDYDDSLVRGQIVASIMHLPHVTASEDRDLGLLLRSTRRWRCRADGQGSPPRAVPPYVKRFDAHLLYRDEVGSPRRDRGDLALERRAATPVDVP
jgi:hypothetical protein